jgi:hypothetical protein
MKMLAWLTVIYAVASTIALLFLHFRLTRPTALSKELMGVPLGDLKPIDKLEALVKISEIRKGEVPWYERSLSTI